MVALVPSHAYAGPWIKVVSFAKAGKQPSYHDCCAVRLYKSQMQASVHAPSLHTLIPSTWRRRKEKHAVGSSPHPHLHTSRRCSHTPDRYRLPACMTWPAGPC